MASAWVCASRSLFNIVRIFSGKLSTSRATLAIEQIVECSAREVLPFPKPHRGRRRVTVASRQLPVVTLDGSETDEVECNVSFGPKGR
jgi:hypothetical protein